MAVVVSTAVDAKAGSRLGHLTHRLRDPGADAVGDRLTGGADDAADAVADRVHQRNVTSPHGGCLFRTGRVRSRRDVRRNSGQGAVLLGPALDGERGGAGLGSGARALPGDGLLAGDRDGVHVSLPIAPGVPGQSCLECLGEMAFTDRGARALVVVVHPGPEALGPAPAG